MNNYLSPSRNLDPTKDSFERGGVTSYKISSFKYEMYAQ